MESGGLLGWTPGQPTAVIDLGEEFAPDPSNASTAALQFSTAYYAVDSSAEGNGSKKRKIERACDFCRRRKARCDGPSMPDNVCTNCISNSRACTYVEGSKPRGPPKAYVVGLEDRVEKMEALLKRLRPELDLTSELGPPIIRDSWKNEPAAPQPSDEAMSNSPQAAQVSPSTNKAPSPVSLTAPPPIRAAYPATASDKGRPVAKSRPVAGKKGLKTKKPRGSSKLDPASNSDHDASCSSLSDSSETDEAGELSIVRGLKRLTLRGLEPTEASPDHYGTDNQWRFHGKSSSFKLISTTRGLIQKHIENVSNSSDDRQSNSPASVQLSSASSSKRPEYWTVPAWEKAYEHADDPTVLPDFLLPAFPPPDLAETLIRNFFQYNNITFPLLHRPTFERQWNDKLYTRNVWFACVCLAIFGLGSRWSSDPRVLPDEVADKAEAGEDDGIWTLAGWRYIAVGTKLHEARRSVLLPPELFEIQSFALFGQYFRGTVAQHGSWFYLSVGVLKAQDVGAHRRKIYGRKPTVEEELWKRAYWHLVAFDRVGSMLIGRPCCTREEDLDLELPLEVDDEYWENENPELAFKQPEGKPSLVTAFVHWIKLSHIVAFALKMLYSPSKPQGDVGRGSLQDQEKTVEQLNEALTKWLDELPPHLRWRPDMEDPAFGTQAATLYTAYHLVQTLIYRPFIRIPRGSSASLPQSSRRHACSQKALAICVSSARACAYIHSVQMRRGMWSINNIVHVSFVSAGIFLVHLWDLIRQYGTQRWSSPEERSQMSQEISSVMAELGDCMARLEEISPKWELAREMLDELKGALPDSPTDDSPPQTLSSSESSIPAHVMPSTSRLQPHAYPQQISPLTPPDRYDLHGYQGPPPAQPVPRAPAPSFPSAPISMQMSLDSSGLPQLWDMDGAPASPPPLADFAMFMAPQLPPQQFTSTPIHKPPAGAHLYPQHHTPRHPVPDSNVAQGQRVVEHMRRNSGYQNVLPAHLARSGQHSYEAPFNPNPQPQPYPPRLQLSHPSPQGYGGEPHSFAADYRPSYLKHEDAPFDDQECLRLRLLEEAYRQRQLAGPRRESSGNLGPFAPAPPPPPPPSAGRHPSGQWAPGPSRWAQ
ncbi:fungal-specific transcription factor domain-containing protein [Trametes punicea]|nr:fungal-specific transcription factor domain-containing protein [Trametes punicea]